MVPVYPQPPASLRTQPMSWLLKAHSSPLLWRMTPSRRPLPLSTATGACRSVVTPAQQAEAGLYLARHLAGFLLLTVSLPPLQVSPEATSSKISFTRISATGSASRKPCLGHHPSRLAFVGVCLQNSIHLLRDVASHRPNPTRLHSVPTFQGQAPSPPRPTPTSPLRSLTFVCAPSSRQALHQLLMIK